MTHVVLTTADWFEGLNVTDAIATALEGLEAGFPSEGARKRALEGLNRAYSKLHDQAHDAQIAEACRRWPSCDDEETHRARGAFYDQNHLPFDLHQVRDRHMPIFERFGGQDGLVGDLLATRAKVKAAPIAPIPVKSEHKDRAETVRRTLMEELERRQQTYVRGLKVGRLFNRLPVSINVHLVHGHKGTVFLRCFYYLAGELTPLQTILAVMDQLEREKEGELAPA